MPTLFMWARPEAVASDAILQAKAPYLNVPFFIVRAVVYFAFWMLCVVAAEQVVGRAGPRRGRDRPAGHACASAPSARRDCCSSC